MEIRNKNGEVIGETRSAVYAYKKFAYEGCEIYSYPIGIVSPTLLGLWAIQELEETIDILENPIPTNGEVNKMTLTEQWSDNKPDHYEVIGEKDGESLIVITKSHNVVSYPIRGGKDGNTMNWSYIRGQVYLCHFGSPVQTGRYTLMN